MPWNIIEEKERYIIQCSGDELAFFLPEEVLMEATENEELQKAIDEQYSKSRVLETYVQKKDMVSF